MKAGQELLRSTDLPVKRGQTVWLGLLEGEVLVLRSEFFQLRIRLRLYESKFLRLRFGDQGFIQNFERDIRVGGHDNRRCEEFFVNPALPRCRHAIYSG